MQLALEAQSRLSRNAHYIAARLNTRVISASKLLATVHQVHGMPYDGPEHALAAAQTDNATHVHRCGFHISTSTPPTPAVMALGPRVEHLSAAEDTSLRHAITQQLQLPEWFVHELVAFGAIHWCPIPPALTAARAADMDPEHVSKLQTQRQALISVYGRQPLHSQPQRATQDVPVNKHAYIRVHVHPKRFPAVYAADWKRQVIHEGKDFVVVHKPAGVPVSPTVDNVIENALYCTTQALQHAEPLKIVHQLDVATEGLLVLGRNKAFVQHFNQLSQQEGTIQKYYKALTQQPPKAGRLVHYIQEGQRTKGQSAHSTVHHSPLPGSHRCMLDVLQVQPVAVTPEVATAWGATAYESLIQLHTGRTHQIRAQLAAEGFPLYSDTLYATGQQTNEQLQTIRKEPAGAVGLQACKLVIAETEMLPASAFEAHAPWWAGSS